MRNRYGPESLAMPRGVLRPDVSVPIREGRTLGAAAVNGREPRLIIVVTVREAFLHCGKALKRSRLWRDDYRVDKKNFPSLGRMIVEQTKPKEITVEQADTFIEENYVTGLY